MRKSIICLFLIVVLASMLLLNVSAAAPGVSLSRNALSGGKYTVTVSFTDIPANNRVEYAQILLTCRTSQHSITNNSLSMKATGSIKVTQQFNTAADSLLVLIEPTVNSFAGIGSEAVFTFTVSQSGSDKVDPGFDLSAILILKDGTEKEINQRVTATNPAESTTTKPTTAKPTTVSTPKPTTVSTTKPTTVPTTVPTTISTQPGVQDPCAKGHTFENGFCIYCAEPDPNYDPCAKGHTFKNGFCIYCAEHDPNYNPCAKGHTFRDGHCIYCAEPDPNYNPCAKEHTFKNGYCIYCLELDPNWDPNIPTTENPTTAVTNPTPAPTTVQPPVNNDVVVDGEDASEPPYWIIGVIAVAALLVGIGFMVVALTKKK